MALTDKEKAIEHISFEFNRFIICYEIFNTSNGVFKQICAQSFLLHGRNIIEFFNNGKSYKDDIKVEHYDVKLVKSFKIDTKSLNKRLLHLSYCRNDNTKYFIDLYNKYNEITNHILLFKKEIIDQNNTYSIMWNKGEKIACN